MPCRFMAGWTRWNGRGAQRAKTRRAGFMRTWTLKLSAVFPLSAAPAFRMRGREDFHRLKVPGQICQGDSPCLLHRLSRCQEQGTGCLKAPVQIVVCFPFVCCTGFPDAGAGGCPRLRVTGWICQGVPLVRCTGFPGTRAVKCRQLQVPSQTGIHQVHP